MRTTSQVLPQCKGVTSSQLGRFTWPPFSISILAASKQLLSAASHNAV